VFYYYIIFVYMYLDYILITNYVVSFIINYLITVYIIIV